MSENRSVCGALLDSRRHIGTLFPVILSWWLGMVCGFAPWSVRTNSLVLAEKLYKNRLERLHATAILEPIEPMGHPIGLIPQVTDERS